MVTLFLGAGFSKWAFDLPLVDKLFDLDINPTSEQEEKKLALIQKDWINWLRKNPDESPEKFVYWCMNKSSHRKSRVIWYVNRRLTEPFMTRMIGSDTAAMFDERIVRENDRIINLKEFFEVLSRNGLSGILTCNYDNLVEYTLGTSGFNYGIIDEQLSGRGKNPQLPWQNAHPRVTGKIPLVKLHGSLSWDKDTKYTSGKPGRAGKAFILPPAPEKFPPEELREVWNLGAEILKKSNCLVVFGFAFNSYDKALLEYLEKNGTQLKRVILIDPYPKEDMAKSLWPQCSIEIINPLNNFDMRVWTNFLEA